MINSAAFLALVEIEEYLRQKATEAGLQRSTHESLVIFGVLLALTAALFIWAYYLRQKRRRRHHHRRSSHSSQENAGNAVAGGQVIRRRRRRRHRRREHRPRNPTLAETGGLPPIRPEDQPPPPV